MLPLLFLAAVAVPADEPKPAEKPPELMSAATFGGLGGGGNRRKIWSGVRVRGPVP